MPEQFKCLIVVSMMTDGDKCQHIANDFLKEVMLPFVPVRGMHLNFGINDDAPLVVKFVTWHHERNMFTVLMDDFAYYSDIESFQNDAKWLTETCEFRKAEYEEISAAFSWVDTWNDGLLSDDLHL